MFSINKDKLPAPNKYRMIGLFLAMIVVLFIIISTLFDSQIVHGNEYLANSISSNATSETVKASRGLITDRNGKLLVSNTLTYTITLTNDNFSSDEELNTAIYRLIELCMSYGTSWVDELPVSRSAPYTYLTNKSNEEFTKFATKNKLEIGNDATAFLLSLRSFFHIDSSYTIRQARLIAGVRYELYLHPSYVFAENVPVEMLSQIVDGHYKGVTTGTSTARVYNTEYASHILGRITRIYAEDWNNYKDLGYSMDSLVGESGVEKAFESYLRGTDGTRLITTNKAGEITSELYTSDPQPGGTVALTIDIDLQEKAEKALASTIESMIDTDSNERGGAAAVIKVDSGEVLALASYPTYNLSTFFNDYSQLLQDERLPMFNRATDGTYAPGSTFKLNTAVAALESGIITPTTEIQDKGIYTYYTSPQPMCWIYRQGGSTHGRINVTQAVTVSCNYFFYDVGRQLGIAKIDDFASQFGLGRSTGIEIGDSSGALASPEYAQSHNLDWTDGQTITAAIGQSYNLFTPLQLSNYVATLVNGGNHYQAHLLKNVKSYDNSEILYVYNEGPENIVEMSDSTRSAVTEGMHNLTTSSLSSSFKNCIVSAGAKTGSAQVGTDIANGVFVCFAPYEDPEIAVAIVIEKGGSGSALASTAVDIINAYFSLDASDTAIISENTLIR